ncbi:MAG: polysaccharide biosynthesis protein [Oscillospiraceae bacterium]|nr:polysaccharide biosynthesis protein [Oscillospiraceae bacterium]MCI9307888.1 polysaccharide biosynthesis protein [Oscillospiraceae bacterium]MCI9548117.1 polysaccharide biosynthesis protein [Oscillospiraceae bacterium]
MSKKRPKICFAASSGGHLEELLVLRPLMERYDSFIVTEKTAYTAALGGVRCRYLLQVNRREWGCLPRMAVNAARALLICLTERPDAVVCTGALATVPLCLLARGLGAKLVFIESYAKVESPTRTGKLLYRFAHRFYVQWPELREHYPNALYVGGIY